MPASISRRRFLGATAGSALGGAAIASGAAGRASAAGAGVDLETWFEKTDNYDGVVDWTGRDRVTIEVGAAGNGGGYAFEPAAVRVDPGTTVVWEWTGDGGVHNVVAENGRFESPMQSDVGATFEHGFDATGASLYACVPHEAMGMRGAVLVGDVAASAPAAAVEPNYGDWFEGVENFEGTVDRTGREQVTVAVGAEGNGGALAFDPPAVRVDPGTTVVWEWTGEGAHDVVDERTGYDSGVRREAGETFALTFDSKGISKYACTAHAAEGMRGAVVVGPATGQVEVTPAALLLGGGLGAALLSPLALGLVMRLNESRPWRRPPRGGHDRPTHGLEQGHR